VSASSAAAPDPIEATLVGQRLAGAARGMLGVLRRQAAGRPLLGGDCGAGVLDREGRLVAYAGAIAHLPPLRASAGALLARLGADLRPGDVLATNDPYGGGTVVSCMTLLAPAAGEAGLCVAVRGRHADAGGAAPGGVYVPAYETYQEGDRLPPIRLARDGRPAPDIWKRLVKNNRLPQVYEVDLAAMLAALRWGADALAAVQARWEAATLRGAVEQALAAGERAFQRALRGWPAGTYRGDSDAVADPRGGGDRAVRVALTVSADGLAIDLAGTSPQAAGCLNRPPAGALAAALGPLLALAGPDLAADEGFLRAVRLAAPPGTLVNPTFPAATGLGPTIVGALVAQAVNRALDQCLPGQAPAAPGPAPFVRLLRHADNAVRASGRTPVAGLPFGTFYTGTSWLELAGPTAPDLPSAEVAEQEWGLRVWERGSRLVLETLEAGTVLSGAAPDGRVVEQDAMERGARLRLTGDGW